jgi:hypothetical protein
MVTRSHNLTAAMRRDLLRTVRERHKDVCIAIRKFDPDLSLHGNVELLKARKAAYEQQIAALVAAILEGDDGPDK